MPARSPLLGPSYTLVAIATIALQLAVSNRQGFVPHEWMQLAFVVLAALIIHRSARSSSKSTGGATMAVTFFVLAALPFVADFFQRMYSPFGNPFEVQLVLCLRNLMIGLCGKSQDSRSLKFASMASAFLALYSFLWLMDRWMIALIFVYAVIGMWWLMGAYWDRLSGCFLSHSERRIPWKPVLGAAAFGILVALVSLPLVGTENYTTAIMGFMPSSGGTGGQDDHAFGGVGDGPQMVSAKEDASGFGPIESELFLESKMPSLYDVLNEFSEPPPKPKKRKRQRAIPLAASNMKQNHKRRGTNQKASREFSAVRKRKQETPDVKDLRSRALLQVVGRVPVHLGMHAYDMWDGEKLTSSDTSEAADLTLELDMTESRNWVRLVGVGPDEILTHKARHEVRVINLKTDRLPMPPNLCGAHIDKLHTAKLFKPTSDGMLSLDMAHIPQLSILHVESLQRTRGQFPLPTKVESDHSNQDEWLVSLAKTWTEGVQPGWPQVESVCDHLRQEYTLDPEAMVPEHVEDAAQYFLQESKRGPDYLFATSAALLLRTLGYDARVISGFYAKSENYDRQSRVTSVFADDAHFWVEVLASANAGDVPDSAPVSWNRWIAVEPTPGYEVLLAPQSLWSRLLERAALTWNVVKRNPYGAIAMIILAATLWNMRVYLLDIAVTGWWLLIFRWGDVRQRVQSTVRLLERRARVHGCPRAKGVSLSKWSQSGTTFHAPNEDWRQRFFEIANWALYGEGIPSGYSGDQVNALCCQAATAKMRQEPRRHRKFAWMTPRST